MGSGIKRAYQGNNIAVEQILWENVRGWLFDGNYWVSVDTDIHVLPQI